MSLFGSRRGQGPPSEQAIADYLALHHRYCDLLAQSAPNIAAVRRAQLNEASVRAMSMAQLVQSRAELFEQIAWQESELSKLQNIGAYVDSLAQKRQDIARWSRQFSASLEWIIHMNPASPQRSNWEQKLRDAKFLSDERNLSSLTVEQVNSNHAMLQAWAADKKKMDERDRELASELKEFFDSPEWRNRS